MEMIFSDYDQLPLPIDNNDDNELDLMLDMTKKKKKRIVVIDTPLPISLPVIAKNETPNKEPITSIDDASAPWHSTDRDYEYKEMLGRIFARLHAQNPDLIGAPRKFIIKPPQMHREGKRKTVLVNFMEICKGIKREPDHIMTFMLTELSTTGSIDGSKRFIMNGRFQQNGIEHIIRKYTNEYVMCRLCQSPHTRLIKENRLVFLRCENCNASRSVASVKSGYIAQVGKRKK